MLRHLRKMFTAITCSLLALVLLGVQGMSVMSSYQALKGLVDRSLDQGLAASSSVPPVLGSNSDDPGYALPKHLLVAQIVISPTGVVISSNANVVDVDSDVLNDIISQINAGHTSGSFSDRNLVWKCQYNQTTSSTRIAVADTSGVRATLRHQISTDIFVFVAMMSIIFIVSWFLFKQVLRPVEKSWAQQKRFIADASHELKTPLAVILANTQILMKHAKDLPEQDRQWVRSTSEEAGRMKMLVQDLLDLTRSELATEDKTIHVQDDINLSALVDRVTLQFDAVAYEAGCELESTLADNVHVTGDGAELEKLVKILVDNACKYAEKGSTVNVKLEKLANKSKLSVTNFGEPIDPESLPHVFERFYRSDKARSRNSSGSYGLGLAIAQSIAQEHDGSISVCSTKEAGTTFSVVLPLQASA